MTINWKWEQDSHSPDRSGESIIIHGKHYNATVRESTLCSPLPLAGEGLGERAGGADSGT